MNATPHDKTSTPNDELDAPNDDGFVIGTAGREEDPNTTTDWKHPGDANDVLTPEDSRGMPGYPRADDSSPSQEGSTGSETAGQDNDKVD